VLKTRPADSEVPREAISAGFGVIAFGIGCCAFALAVVVAVAFAATM
jgi:hypothetical protein